MRESILLDNLKTIGSLESYQRLQKKTCNQAEIV